MRLSFDQLITEALLLEKKSVVDGKKWYHCYTHRVMAIRPTLKGAISAFDFIKTTS